MVGERFHDLSSIIEGKIDEFVEEIRSDFGLFDFHEIGITVG